VGGASGRGRGEFSGEDVSLKKKGTAKRSVWTPAQTEMALLWTAHPVATYFGAFGQFAVYLYLTSRRRHRIFKCDWSSDVCSSDLRAADPRRELRLAPAARRHRRRARRGLQL